MKNHKKVSLLTVLTIIVRVFEDFLHAMQHVKLFFFPLFRFILMFFYPLLSFVERLKYVTRDFSVFSWRLDLCLSFSLYFLLRIQGLQKLLIITPVLLLFIFLFLLQL